MRRSRRIWIAIGVLLWALGGCKCGKKEGEGLEPKPGGPEYESTVSKLPGVENADVAALIPADATCVVISENLTRLLDWIEGRAWFQEIKKTTFVDDLRFTNLWFRLSTLKHRLESLSAVRIKQPNLKELLATPTALAIRLSPELVEVLLVKQVDLRIQALDRLMEVLNQINLREGVLVSQEIDGLLLRELKLSESKQVYYLLFSNMLLASNSKPYLLQAVELARGKSSGSVATDPEVKALILNGRENYDLVASLNLFGLDRGKKPAILLEPEDKSWLGLRLVTGEKPHLEVTATIGKGQAEPERNAAPFALEILPLDSRLVLGLSHLDLNSLWEDVIERDKKAGVLPQNLKFSVGKKLLPALERKVTLVFGGVDTSGDQPVPHIALTLGLKKGKASEVEALTEQLFTFLFNQKPNQRVLHHMSEQKVYLVPGWGAFKPGFAVVDQWLVVCTTEVMLRKIVATSVGHEPAIKDVPGFADKVVAGPPPFFFLSYLDCNLLFEDLKQYSKAVMKRSDRFDLSTIDETVSPLLDALKKIGKLGGAATQSKSGVSGSVVPL